MSISLDEAVGLIQQKREAEIASHLKSFTEEPKMEIRTGRFGPYIAYDGKNYHLPKALAANAKDLTLEQCRDIVAKEPAAKRKRPASKATKKVAKKK